MERAMFAWLADLLEELRSDRMARRAMRELARMEDGTLHDVGIERDMISLVARGMTGRRETRVGDRGQARLAIGTRPVHCG
jgi:uncharacterized protein YjiS (DUF1127 family)